MVGVYEVDDATMVLSFTSDSGYDFRYEFSYYADEQTFVRAAYLLSERVGNTDIYHAYHDGRDSDRLRILELKHGPVSVVVEDEIEEPHGEYRWRWSDSIYGFPVTSWGAFQLPGGRVSLHTYGKTIATFEVVTAGVLGGMSSWAAYGIRGDGHGTSFERTHP